jgi:hypothetical protein
MNVIKQNEVLAELMKKERFFHEPPTGTTRGELEAMTEDTFWEVGASGRLYSREDVLGILEARIAKPSTEIWETSDAGIRELGADFFLLSYTLMQGKRKTRRTTIWHRVAHSWKAVYHQGTIVEEH